MNIRISWILVAALLAGCSATRVNSEGYSLNPDFSHVSTSTSFSNLKAIEQHEPGGDSVIITGDFRDSALSVVETVSAKEKDGTVWVGVVQKLVILGDSFSGSGNSDPGYGLNVKIPVSSEVKRVVFGSDRVVVWQRSHLAQ